MCQNRVDCDAVAIWYVCFNFDAVVVIAPDNAFYFPFCSFFGFCGVSVCVSVWKKWKTRRQVIDFCSYSTQTHTHAHTHVHTHQVNWLSQPKVHWSRRCGDANTHLRCFSPTIFPFICRMHILCVAPSTTPPSPTPTPTPTTPICGIGSNKWKGGQKCATQCIGVKMAKLPAFAYCA